MPESLLFWKMRRTDIHTVRNKKAPRMFAVCVFDKQYFHQSQHAQTPSLSTPSPAALCENCHVLCTQASALCDLDAIPILLAIVTHDANLPQWPCLPLGLRTLRRTKSGPWQLDLVNKETLGLRVYSGDSGNYSKAVAAPPSGCKA
jgi:hypothetical protein